jgi:plastocyanin
VKALAITVAAVAALGLATPADAAPKQLTYRYGPITLSPYEVDQNTILGGVPKPAVDGFITGMEVDVVDARGRKISPAHVMLHHVVFLNLGLPGKFDHRDWTCSTFTTLNGDLKVPALADRFYAAGEERNRLKLPPGYGYPVKGQDNWVLLWMLMNHHNVEDSVYIEYKITYESEQQLAPAYMVWLDVKNCLQDPVFDVPGGGARDSTYSRSVTWTAPMSGRLVAGGGHLHGGGKSAVLSQPDCADRELFDSRPLYGLANDPVYLARPVMHEPGPINMSGFLSPRGLPVAKGQKLKLTANYENRYPHTRVMGIFGIYFVPDPSVGSGCTPLPPIEVDAASVPGRRYPPRFRIPLARKPAGRVRKLRSGATIHVRDFRFDKERIRVRRGALLRWKFDGFNLHDVTVATGPRGFSSPNLDGGRVFRQKLKVPGTYRLFCTLHSTEMVQEIRVTRR